MLLIANWLLPNSSFREPSTEVPAVTTHAHRHHHGAVSAESQLVAFVSVALGVFFISDTHVFKV